ncbi:MAG: hypothetical protein F6K41_24200 [Symploca sp. SIO3E6]|nr:hypothetical protein [Caldora sp. SIO3E6]
MISVLFDEAHQELFRLPSPSGESETAQQSALRQVLESELNWSSAEIKTHSGEPGSLTSEILIDDGDRIKYKILVLLAPTCGFTLQEIQTILEFVALGGSLLVAVNYESLRRLEQGGDNSTNELMGKFRLKFKQLYSYPPDTIEDFVPHYLTSEVNRCYFYEPIYLKVLPEKLPDKLLYPPSVVAKLPKTGDACLVAAELEEGGRVVAIADHIIFEDNYLQYGNNQQLVLNIFRWLAAQNFIDCFDAQINTEVLDGVATTFSISLSNPHGTRLEYIDCLLESDSGVEIAEPSAKVIRSLAPYREAKLEWQVKPTQLGTHKLKLIVDRLKTPNPLFFDTVAQFQCIPNVEIDLVIQNHHENVPELLEIGKPVEVKAVFRPKTDVVASSVQLSVATSSPQLVVEPIEQSETNYRWRLTAQEAGAGTIALVVKETGQRISRLIQVRPSVQAQIAEIEKTIVNPLKDEIRRRVVELQCGLEAESIQQISFRICTPEALVSQIYSGSLQEKLLELLRVARMEEQENLPLVRQLLRYIAPTFSPTNGCYLPYDPQLASHLAQEHRAYRDNLAQNLLSIEGSDQIWLEQNIAALILHEQYGHGFFFTQTTLGKQLAILHRQGMTRNANPKSMRSPYPRKLYEEYQNAIRALWDSAVIVNEGFATWLELTILPLLSGVIGQAALRRRDFLFNRDDGLYLLSQDSQYFQQFPPFGNSRYQEGCQLFQRIQEYFGSKSGIRAVVQAMIEITDIDVGITENQNQVQFSLSQETLMDSLLDPTEDDALADKRLRHIYSELGRLYNREKEKSQNRYNFVLNEDMVNLYNIHEQPE